MRCYIRRLQAALIAAIASCTATACAEDATITVRLFRVKTSTFEKGLLEAKRPALRLVYDRGSVADLEALLRASQGQCLATASARQAAAMALNDSHTEKVVRDVDLEIGANGVRGDPVESALSWGMSLTVADGMAADGLGFLMTLKGSVCLPRATRRVETTDGGRIDLPGLSSLILSAQLVVPPGGAVILGGSDLEDPEFSLVLVVGSRGDARAAADAPEASWVAVWWLDPPSKDVEALMKGVPRFRSLGPDQVEGARKAKARMWAFAPTWGEPFDLVLSNQQAIVQDYDEEVAAGRSVWDPVIGRYAETVRFRFDLTKLKLEAEIVDRPMAEKKVAGGKKSVPVPVGVSAAAESDLTEKDEAQDWLLPVSNPLGVPFGPLLVSVRGQKR